MDKEYTRKQQAEYREANKEKIAKQRKEYREKNKELLKERRSKNREAISEYNQKYREENKQKAIEYTKRYREENKEILKQRNAKYRSLNKDKESIRRKKYYQENKEILNKKANQASKQKRANNPLFRISCALRNRTRRAFTDFYKSKKTTDLIGCSNKELIIHLQNQFVEGMTLENHGYNGWHIDHIIPLSSAKTLDELEKLCHYTNLQPLWAEENLRKSDS